MLVLCKAGIFSFFSCVCGPKFSSKTMASEALSISLPKVGGEILQMTTAVLKSHGTITPTFFEYFVYLKNTSSSCYLWSNEAFHVINKQIF